MERYDKMVTEIQELIASEELEIAVLRQHTTGITAKVAIAIRSELVAKFKGILDRE